jgi:hypothetical protein
MRIDPALQFFFGFKIDSKLRDALGQASPGEKQFFADDSPYLRVLSNGTEHWIGKVIAAPVALGDIEDIQRNVISILNRVASSMRHPASGMRVFAIGEGESTPLVYRVRHTDGDDGNPS